MNQLLFKRFLSQFQLATVLYILITSYLSQLANHCTMSDLDAREAAIVAREEAVARREAEVEAREAAVTLKEQNTFPEPEIDSKITPEKPVVEPEPRLESKTVVPTLQSNVVVVEPEGPLPEKVDETTPAIEPESAPGVSEGVSIEADPEAVPVSEEAPKGLDDSVPLPAVDTTPVTNTEEPESHPNVSADVEEPLKVEETQTSIEEPPEVEETQAPIDESPEVEETQASIDESQEVDKGITSPPAEDAVKIEEVPSSVAEETLVVSDSAVEPTEENNAPAEESPAAPIVDGIPAAVEDPGEGEIQTLVKPEAKEEVPAPIELEEAKEEPTTVESETVTDKVPAEVESVAKEEIPAPIELGEAKEEPTTVESETVTKNIPTAVEPEANVEVPAPIELEEAKEEPTPADSEIVTDKVPTEDEPEAKEEIPAQIELGEAKEEPTPAGSETVTNDVHAAVESAAEKKESSAEIEPQLIKEGISTPIEESVIVEADREVTEEKDSVPIEDSVIIEPTLQAADSPAPVESEALEPTVEAQLPIREDTKEETLAKEEAIKEQTLAPGNNETKIEEAKPAPNKESTAQEPTESIKDPITVLAVEEASAPVPTPIEQEETLAALPVQPTPITA
jgi:hypothetical protein